MWISCLQPIIDMRSKACIIPSHMAAQQELSRKDRAIEAIKQRINERFGYEELCRRLFTEIEEINKAAGSDHPPGIDIRFPNETNGFLLSIPALIPSKQPDQAAQSLGFIVTAENIYAVPDLNLSHTDAIADIELPKRYSNIENLSQSVPARITTDQIPLLVLSRDRSYDAAVSKRSPCDPQVLYEAMFPQSTQSPPVSDI